MAQEPPPAPSLQDYLCKFPEHTLHSECADEHLLDLSKSIGYWCELTPYLNLTPADEDEIKMSSVPPKRQRIDALRLWKRKLGKQATYMCLIEALFKAERKDLIDELCTIVTTQSQVDIPFPKPSAPAVPYSRNNQNNASIVHTQAAEPNRADAHRVPAAVSYSAESVPVGSSPLLSHQYTQRIDPAPLHGQDGASVTSQPGFQSSPHVPTLTQVPSSCTQALPSQSMPADITDSAPDLQTASLHLSASQSTVLVPPCDQSFEPLVTSGRTEASESVRPTQASPYQPQPPLPVQIQGQHVATGLHGVQGKPHDNSSLPHTHHIGQWQVGSVPYSSHTQLQMQVPHTAPTAPISLPQVQGQNVPACSSGPPVEYTSVNTQQSSHVNNVTNTVWIAPDGSAVVPLVKHDRHVTVISYTAHEQPGTQRALPSTDYLEYVLRYAQYLKDKYKLWTELPDPKWPPLRGEKMTNLALIERERDALSKFDKAVPKSTSIEFDYIHGKIDSIIARKKEIQFPDIFDYEHCEGRPLKVLMDGAPGVGKTTLSRKSCIDWANAMLLQQYKLVVFVALRDERNREAKTVSDLFPADDPEEKQKVVKHVQQSAGEGVLFIFDGFDELSDKDRKQKSLFLDIIKGEKLSKCSVLVTSRPYASDALQRLRSVVRHVEVLGFTEKQIEACIRQNLSDEEKVTELVTKLKERADIASLCYIPLNCAIMIFVYQRHGYELPNTLTDLFRMFILDTLKRHTKEVLNDPNLDGLLSESNLQNLPEPLGSQLMSLSKLAYNSLLRDKLVFSYRELASVFPHCKQASDIQSSCLDLVTFMMTFSSEGEEMYYQFLHLSIQEFLAAFYAWKSLADKEMLSFFEEHLKEDRFHLVLLFLAGLTKLNIPSQKKLVGSESFDLSTTSKSSETKRSFLYFAHLIFESQNFDLYKTLLQCLKNQTVFTMTNCSLSQFDCMVIAHFLSSTNHSWKKLHLEACSLDGRSLKAFDDVCSKYANSQTSFEEVNLSYNRPDLVTKLSSFPRAWTNQTKTFKLHSTEEPKDLSLPVESLCASNVAHISHLDISAQLPSGKETAQCKIHPNSSKLTLHHMSIGEALTAKVEYKALTDIHIGSVPVDRSVVTQVINKPMLQCLSLVDSAISWREAVTLFQALEHSANLKELHLFGNDFRHLSKDESESVGVAVQGMLTANKKLKVLDLHDGAVNDTIATHISSGLVINKSLEHLNVDGIDLHSDTVEKLLLTLKSSGVRLKELLILNVQLTCHTETNVWQIDSIEKCETSLQLKFLVALDNCQLAKSLKLEKINLAVNDLLSDCSSTTEHSAVESILKMSTILKVLDLSDDAIASNTTSVQMGLDTSRVDADTVSKVLVAANSSMLAHLRIYGLDLFRKKLFWQISNQSMCLKFLDALTKTSDSLKIQLQRLDLSGCDVTSDGLCTICKSVVHFFDLEELDLSHNKQIASNPESFGRSIETVLKIHPRIKALHLNDCSLNEPVVIEVMKTISQMPLQILSLDENEFSSCEAANILSAVHSSKLNKLQIEHAKLSRTGRGVWNLNITIKHLVAFLRILQHATMTVQLVHNKLDLSSSTITSTDVATICQSITNPRHLNISDNAQVLENGDVVSGGMKKLLKATKTLKVLRVIRSINDTVAKGITDGIASCSSLVELDASDNELSETSITDLLSAAFSNKYELRDVQVCRFHIARESRTIPWHIKNINHLRKKDISLILHALSDQSMGTLNLKKIKLNDADLTSASVIKICQSVKRVSSLEELDLSCNPKITLGDSGEVGLAFQQMLSRCKTLKLLDLHGCSLDDTTTEGVAAGIVKNSSLIILNVSDSPSLITFVGDTAAEMTEQSMSSNTHTSRSLSEDVILSSANSNSSLSYLQIAHICLHRPEQFWQLTQMTSNVQIFNFCPILCKSTMTISHGELRLQCVDKNVLAVLKCVQNNMKLGVLHLHGSKKPSAAVIKGMTTMLESTKTLKVKILNSRNDAELSEIDITNLLPAALSNKNGLLDVQVCQFHIARESRQTTIPWQIENVDDLRKEDVTLVLHALADQSRGTTLNLKKIELSNANLTSASVIKICRSVKHVSSLEELDLSCNPRITLGDCREVGLAFQKMLCGCKTLKLLELHGCCLNDEIAKGVAAGIAKSASLKMLNVCDRPLLNTFVNDTAADMTEDSSSLCTRISSLSESAITDILSSANSNSSLTCLQVAAHICLHYQPCGQSQRAYLQPRTGNGWRIKHVSKPHNPNFYISLKNSTMSLQELDLSSTDLTSEMALCVFQCVHQDTHLKELNLSGNAQLTAGDCRAVGHCIESMLEGNKSLSVLKLCNGVVNDTLARGIAKGLSTNTSLKEIHMGDTPLSDSTIAHVLSSASHNKTLTVLQITKVTLTQRKIFSRTESGWMIEHVSKAHNPNFYIGLKSSTMSILLKELDLSSTDITSEMALRVLQYVHQDTHLKELNLSGNAHLTAAGDCRAVGHCIESVLEGNKSLSVLKLCNGVVNNTLARGIAKCLSTNTSLKEIHMGDTPLSDSTIAHVLSSASHNKTLTVLQITKVTLTQRKIFSRTESGWMIEHVSKAHNPNFYIGLKSSTMSVPLKELDLSSTDITSEMVLRVLQYVHQDTHLKELNLSGNAHLTAGDCIAVGHCIESMLEGNKSLSVLKLCNGVVNDTIARGIAKHLFTNTSLKELRMGDTPLSDSTVAHILSSASRNKTLKVLQITKVTLKQRGTFSRTESGWMIEHVSKPHNPNFYIGIKDSTMSVPLQELDLSSTNLTSEMALCVLQCVHQDTHLKELNLSGNAQLTAGDCRAVGHCIESMLEDNKSLSVLKLCNGVVNDTIATGIAKCLATEITLKELRIGDTPFSDSTIAHVLTSASRNKTLEILEITKVTLSQRKTYLSRTDSGWMIEHVSKPHNPNFYIGIKDSTMSVPLQELDLSSTNLTSEMALCVLQCVHQDTHLKELNLSGNAQLTAGDCRAVGHCIESILAGNKSLSVLKLCNGVVNDALAKYIANNLTKKTTLKVLHLNSSNSLSSDGASCILSSVSCSGLSELEIWNVNLAIAKTRSEWCICFEWHANMKQFFCTFGEILTTCSKLEFTCSDHKYCDGWALLSGLLEIVGHNAAFVELTFTGISFVSPSEVQDDIQTAAERVLSINSALLKFKLCMLPDSLVSGFVVGIRKSQTLRSLHLTQCRVNESSAKDFIDAFSDCALKISLNTQKQDNNLFDSDTLLDVELKRDDTSTPTEEQRYPIATTTKKVKLLNFNATCTDSGARRMLQMLGKTSVEDLQLEFDYLNIGDLSLTAAEKLVQMNTTLKVLRISTHCTVWYGCNCIELCNRVLLGLRYNTTLRKVTLECGVRWRHESTWELIDNLTAMLQQNRSLYELEISQVLQEFPSDTSYQEYQPYTNRPFSSVPIHLRFAIGYPTYQPYTTRRSLDYPTLDHHNKIKQFALALLKNNTLQRLVVGQGVKSKLELEIDVVKTTENIDTSNWKLAIIGR